MRSFSAVCTICCTVLKGKVHAVPQAGTRARIAGWHPQLAPKPIETEPVPCSEWAEKGHVLSLVLLQTFSISLKVEAGHYRLRSSHIPSNFTHHHLPTTTPPPLREAIQSCHSHLTQSCPLLLSRQSCFVLRLSTDRADRCLVAPPTTCNTAAADTSSLAVKATAGIPSWSPSVPSAGVLASEASWPGLGSHRYHYLCRPQASRIVQILEGNNPISLRGTVPSY